MVTRFFLRCGLSHEFPATLRRREGALESSLVNFSHEVDHGDHSCTDKESPLFVGSILLTPPALAIRSHTHLTVLSSTLVTQ